jgi:hypothetical protein
MSLGSRTRMNLLKTIEKLHLFTSRSRGLWCLYRGKNNIKILGQKNRWKLKHLTARLNRSSIMVSSLKPYLGQPWSIEGSIDLLGFLYWWSYTLLSRSSKAEGSTESFLNLIFDEDSIATQSWLNPKPNVYNQTYLVTEFVN